jgi:hypothetical protein
VRDFDLFPLLSQGLRKCLWQYGHASFLPSTIAHGDLPIFSMDILDPHTDARQQAQSCTVKQACHAPVVSMDMRPHCPGLGMRQNHRQAFRILLSRHLA